MTFSHRSDSFGTRWIDEADKTNQNDPGLREEIDMILVGLGRYGTALAQVLHGHGVRVLGVDFDPEALARWKERGLPGVFGGATDPGFPASLPLERVSCVIIATPPPIPGTPQEDSRLIVKKALRRIGFKGKIAVRSHDELDGQRVAHIGGDICCRHFPTQRHERRNSCNSTAERGP